jgi:PadR family transcriptional regulator AphA
LPTVNKTKYALLGMLMCRPMSGYEMKKLSDSSLSHFWSENYGHIYPILRLLESEGLAKHVVRRTAGKPDRHVYDITGKGERVFLEWLRKPAAAEIRRNEFLLKLFFAGFLPLPDILQIIEFEKDRCASALEKYSQIDQGIQANKEIAREGKDLYWPLTLRYGKKLEAARHQWCLDVLRELKK